MIRVRREFKFYSLFLGKEFEVRGGYELFIVNGNGKVEVDFCFFFVDIIFFFRFVFAVVWLA